MTKSEGSRVHRHPDAADCLESLTEGEAAVHPPVVREHGDGFARCWLEGGEVRSRDVAAAELPLAGHRPDGGRPAEFGPLLPRLAADPGSGAPDLDGGGRALRDASPGGGAAAPSFCRAAGRDAAGAGVRGLRQADGPAFVVVEVLASSRLGRVEVERSRFRCRSCGKGRFPPDRALGLEGGTVTPGMASVIAGTVPLMGFEAASRHVDSLAGVDASSSALQRRAPELGEAAARFEREEVVDGKPLEPRMQLSVDGTGVPMRREETEGVRGRQADGTSKTREARLAVACTAEGRDPGTGAALKDRGSESSGCLTGGAAAPSGGREASDFAARRDREARRRGLHDAGGPVVVSDGADWIPNACEGPFGGRKVTFVPGLFHCLERASDAARRSCRRGRSGTGGSRRRGGRQGGPGGEGGPGAGALQGPARGSRGLLPAFREEPRPDAARRVPGTGRPGRKAASSRADAGSSGCGSSAPERAGRRGAPTPCWR